MTVNIKIFQIGLDHGAEYALPVREILATCPFYDGDKKKAIVIGRV